jgi:hypothetical protein
MPDLAQIRIAEGKFVCNILPHKKLSRSQQHLMTEAPIDAFPLTRHAMWVSLLPSDKRGLLRAIATGKIRLQLGSGERFKN